MINIPLKPMVGRPVASAQEAFDHFQKDGKVDIIAEVKYDGERT